MKPRITRILIFIVLTLATGVRACIWDTDTLADEKAKHPDLADLILGQTNPVPDPAPLRERIKTLEASPQTNDSMWWNNLAGAHLRLGEPQIAVQLLEPVVSRFDNDYGIHANLGTAYHLLGRYPDAEKEIARDLEINPQGHFGLEKYHLALLQYLIRDTDYQGRHVFVDEYSTAVLQSSGAHFFWTDPDRVVFTNSLDDRLKELAGLKKDYQEAARSGAKDKDDDHADNLLMQMAALDDPPAYRAKWDLGTDTNFQAGVMYMASMNPREPACFVMLGMVSWKNGNLNLAVTAFRQAIAMGSPQPDLLRWKIQGMIDNINRAQLYELQQRHFRIIVMLMSDGFLLVAFVAVVILAIKVKKALAANRTSA